MNRMNGLIASALAIALGGLHRLSDAGCTVVRVDVQSGRPVLCLDAPPPGPWVRGAMRRRQCLGGEQVTVMVADYHGCLIQWMERAPVRRRPRQQVTA